MGILLKRGSLIDADSKELIQGDVLVEGNTIARIDSDISIQGHQVIDIEGKLVSAGFIDMHVHLRDPGFPEKETIATGALAAARGGFTTIACMPNTYPTVDSSEIVQYILEEAKRVNVVRVLSIGAVTKHQLGEELTDMDALCDAGVIGFSDDGVGVQLGYIMKMAMKKAKELGLPIIAHCEDNSLVQGGCVHDGSFSIRHGLPGLPSEAESVHIARDILLAEKIGVHYHVCHVSSKESVRLIREAKKRGQNVTAEVTPHHLLLTEEDIPGLDSMYKMNPPLRSRADQEALIAGLMDGTIDIIATDHAPHTLKEKSRNMQKAPFGIVGLETAFPLLYTNLVLKGICTLSQLVEKMTMRPREIFGLPQGVLHKDGVADLTIIDLETERVIDPVDFLSKGKNTPFSGWRVKGWPIITLMNGRVTWNQQHTMKEMQL